MYPEHYYVAFGGKAYEQEEWQCGIRMGGGTAPGDGPNGSPEALADVAADVRKFWESAGAKAPMGYTLEYCKFNKIGPDGRYASPSDSNTFLYPSGLTGTTTVSKAPQLAVVISFRTLLTRGPGSKGRMYWLGAGFGHIVDSGVDYLISDAHVDALAQAAKVLVQDLGNWPGLDISDLTPCVVSKVGSGSATEIIKVLVDNRFDTQRRRASKMPHTYTTKVIS